MIRDEISTAPANWSCREGADRRADFHGRFTAESSGPLYIYANDVRFLPGIFYRNNSGQAAITITRRE